MAYAALLGGGAGAGLLLIVLGLKPRSPGARRRLLQKSRWERAPLRLAVAIGLGIVVAALTRWPVGAALAGLGSWWLPVTLGRDPGPARAVARIEAIASWTESLRDTLAAGAGLEQTIAVTAEVAPAAIAHEVAELAAAIEAGERLPSALRAFADRLDDPTGDLVVASLVLAAERQASDLSLLLGRLASATREQAGMRMRVAAARGRVRASVRIIIASTLVLSAGLFVWSRDYLDPYDTAVGQTALLAVGLCFAAAFSWMRRIGQIDQPPRVLTGLPGRTEP